MKLTEQEKIELDVLEVYFRSKVYWMSEEERVRLLELREKESNSKIYEPNKSGKMAG
jgi:hypothetical protein